MDHKQNILIVHNYYQIPGGEDTVVTNEMKMLQKHGHEVTLYTRDNKELKTMGKVKKLLLPFTTIFNLKTYRDIKRIIKDKNIKIVHVHNTLNLISPSVYYAALACHVPVVQTIHNFRLLCPGATFYRDGHICEDCVTKGLGCAVKHNCYRNSKFQTLACVINTKIHRMTGIYGKINYICLTEFNKEKLLQLKQIKAGRVFVKPNFVEQCNDDNKNFQRDGFIFVGRLEEIKGIHDLLEAWKKLGNRAPLLRICGTGPLEQFCKEFINSNRINTIKLCGFINHTNVIDMISKSKYLILPTRVYEGFPMTIVEAYSVGTPVIVPNLGNAGNLVVNGKTGFSYLKSNPDSLADCVLKAEMNPNLSNMVSEFYFNNYTEQANCLALEMIYSHIKEE